MTIRYSDIVTTEGDGLNVVPVPIVGASVIVTASNGALATLTKDDGTAIIQPVFTDGGGMLEFNVPSPGDVYSFQYRYGGRLIREADIIIGNPPQFKGDPGSNGNSVGPFSALSGMNILPGTNSALVDDGGRILADTSLTDADVAAFPRTIKKTANSRYFRRDEAVVTAVEVGVNGSPGPTGDYGAMLEALAYLKRFGNAYGGVFRGTPRLKLAPYTKLDGGTLSLKQTVIIEGDGNGLEGGRPSIIDASGNAGTAIIMERADTLNGGVNVPTTTGADGSILRNFALLGGSGPTGQDARSGISLKARALLESLYVENFPGSGLRIVANSGGTGEARGNANCFKARDVTIYGCYDNIYLSGTDVNAGVLSGCNVNYSARCGVLDASFLGNLHLGHHSSANGLGANGASVMVSYGGRRYAARYGHDPYWSTTAPGVVSPTGQTAWIDFEAGGPIPSIPTWVAGGSYMWGANYATINRNARSSFVGCYTEGTQAPPQIMWPSIALGGPLNNLGDSPSLTGEQGVFNGGAFATGAVLIDGSGVGLYGQDAIFRLKPNGHDIRADWNNGDSAHPFDITGPLTTSSFGPNTLVLNQRLAFRSDAVATSYATDAAAAAGGVPVGAVYRNGSQLMIRAS